MDGVRQAAGTNQVPALFPFAGTFFGGYLEPHSEVGAAERNRAAQASISMAASNAGYRNDLAGVVFAAILHGSLDLEILLEVK